MDPLHARLAAAWDSIRERYGAYELLLPGQPSFVCQPNLCNAHCCHAFSVALGEGEVRRMELREGIAPLEFLESEGGAPVALPLARPYLLRRADNRCSLLSRDLACTRYDGRPDACRLYPHQVLLIDEAAGRPAPVSGGAATAAVDGLLREEPLPVVPLLLRHVECPGFTGAPLTAAEWSTLLRMTCELQYGVASS